jgi:hypothetical protein
MKIADYAPGLTVANIHPFSAATNDYQLGTTISTIAFQREGDKSSNRYVQVLWQNSKTTTTSLLRLAISDKNSG